MMEPNQPRFSKAILAAWILLSWALGAWPADKKKRTPEIPKVWDEAALADWVTPVAGLNLRPMHISGKEYYSMPESILRSYPVYMPGREPEGHWDMLQHIGSKPLIQPETLKTEAEWIAAGRLVFEEAPMPQLTTLDPRVISEIRSREFLEQQHVKPAANGVIPGFRWVPTRQGSRPSPGVGAASAATPCSDPTASASPARPCAPRSLARGRFRPAGSEPITWNLQIMCSVARHRFS